MTKINAQKRREIHAHAAAAMMNDILADAELRGITPQDVAVSLAVACSVRFADGLREAIDALRMAVLGAPVTKIVAAPPGTTVD